ncbi:hypothetical protein IQ266_02335 [filamentous cyanobacterium LEGE 11480]|uniref:EfeO-type cupredoxin-like domain-containing protein n=1 Tax=Romeriopsis navalis LEGE 11480 TaxID=2777977 RepID=A0A928Z1K4_9CYAN|nr:hypothetical protein [Romeriopsis navalis]MBE9028594.1 hypothetical protein [Romeriopsis navalis LEGE 11480]
MRTYLRNFSIGLLTIGLVACNNANTQTSNDTTPATIITLTQTGCQFTETEAKDYAFTPKSGDDCKQINQKTLGDRKSQFKPLKLKPGKYIFRVTNSNVPYELGFYLRGKGLSFATLPKVSGGGLTQGVTQDYEIELKPGEYDFSCPLNPTPDYPLVVEG